MTAVQSVGYIIALTANGVLLLALRRNDSSDRLLNRAERWTGFGGALAGSMAAIMVFAMYYNDSSSPEEISHVSIWVSIKYPFNLLLGVMAFFNLLSAVAESKGWSKLLHKALIAWMVLVYVVYSLGLFLVLGQAGWSSATVCRCAVVQAPGVDCYNCCIDKADLAYFNRLNPASNTSCAQLVRTRIITESRQFCPAGIGNELQPEGTREHVQQPPISNASLEANQSSGTSLPPTSAVDTPTNTTEANPLPSRSPAQPYFAPPPP